MLSGLLAASPNVSLLLASSLPLSACLHDARPAYPDSHQGYGLVSVGRLYIQPRFKDYAPSVGKLSTLPRIKDLALSQLAGCLPGCMTMALLCPCWPSIQGLWPVW